MQIPFRKTLAALLLLACLPPWLLAWQAAQDPLAPLLSVHQVQSWLLPGLAIPLGLGLLYLFGYPTARPQLAIYWQRLKRQLGTDRGPYFELLARLRNFDNQDDRLRAGRMARQFGDRQAALEHLRAAWEHDKRHVPSSYEYGLVLGELGRGEEAAAVLQGVVEVEPHCGNGDALLRLAEARLALGELDAAAACVDQHQQQYPGNRQVHLLRAKLEARRGDMERARQELLAARRPTEPHERLTAEDRLAQARAKITVLRKGVSDG